MSISGQQYPELASLINEGKLSEAEKILDSELARTPGNPELVYWKAAIAIKAGRPAEAEKTLSGIIDTPGARPPHFLLLADIYNSRREWAKSAGVYRKALAQQYSPRLAYNLGLAEFQAKNYEGAIEAIEPLTKDRKVDPSFNHLLGLSYFGLNDYTKALPHLRVAAEEAPDNPNRQYDYALALLQAEELEAAVSYFRKTIQLQPSWARAHLYLGRALHDQNLSEDALEQFRQAERLNSALPLLHHHYGLAYRGRGEFDRAIAEFELEIAAGSNHPATFFQLAELLLNRQQSERAGVLVDRAIRQSPANVDYRLLAAKLAMKENRLEEADRHLAAALQATTTDNRVYFQLGRLRQLQGRSEEARRAFDRSRELADRKSGRNLR